MGYLRTKYTLGWSDPEFCPTDGPSFWMQSSSQFIKLTKCSAADTNSCTKEAIGSSADQSYESLGASRHTLNFYGYTNAEMKDLEEKYPNFSRVPFEIDNFKP